MLLSKIHTFTHRRRCQPCKTTASSSGAVRVRCLAQGHLDTHTLGGAGYQTSNLPVKSQPALPPGYVRVPHLLQDIRYQMAYLRMLLQLSSWRWAKPRGWLWTSKEQYLTEQKKTYTPLWITGTIGERDSSNKYLGIHRGHRVMSWSTHRLPFLQSFYSGATESITLIT